MTRLGAKTAKPPGSIRRRSPSPSGRGRIALHASAVGHLLWFRRQPRCVHPWLKCAFWDQLSLGADRYFCGVFPLYGMDGQVCPAVIPGPTGKRRSRKRRRPAGGAPAAGTPGWPETKTNERFKTMRKSMFIQGLAALVACALVLSVVGSAKHPVERPFKATGIMKLVVDPNDPSGASGTFECVGTATHLGKFVFPGTWAVVGLNEEGGYVYEIHGTYTAANGDTIEIECLDWGIDDGLNPSVSTGMVHIIGGTGRFANASGLYLGTLSPVPTPTVFTFTAEGTISY